jgi:hypothetical protein
MLRINNLREVTLQNMLFEAAAADDDDNGVCTRHFIAGKVQMNPDSLKELDTIMQNVLKYSTNITSLIAGLIQFVYLIYYIF